MRILLAEDNLIARTALAAGLKADGYDLMLAEDGEQALQCARSEHPDFIISDILMPRMDGYSFCQAVRQDSELHDVPLIFYSSTFLDPEDEELARQVGASGFIHKDTDPETFRRRLRELIDAASSLPTGGTWSHNNVLEVEQLHESTLIRKLTKKVEELEAEREALRLNQQLLNHIVTTIPDVVFVLKLPGLESSYIAPEAERLIGFSGDEVIGEASRWLGLVHKDDRVRVMDEMMAAVRARQKALIVVRMQHKAGGYRWIEAHLSPRLNEQGEPIELIGSLSDISKRRDAEERLRQSERSLDTLLGNLPGMAYRCENSPEWKMLLLSNGVVELTGYQREELLNNRELSYLELIHPEDRQWVWDEVQQAVQDQRQFSLSYRIRHKDGSTRWVWERGVGVFDAELGKMTIEGFINDITLRKRAEDALLASEERYRNLFEMMESGMAVHELVYNSEGKPYDYRFLEVNPAFERLTGLQEEKTVGRTVREVMPDSEESWIEEYIRVAQTGSPARFIRYSGPLDRYYEVIAYQNEANQFVTLFSDITEQKRAEEEIHNMARFPAENPSPVLRFSSDGELLYANPASRAVLDFCSKNKGGDFCNELTGPAIAALKRGETERLMFEAGERFYSFMIAPIVDGGYANLYGRDVTKRVMADRQLERLNRVLRTLSKGNRSLVHAVNEDELLQSVCQVLVNEGDYPFVWVAYDQENSQPRAMVQCGQLQSDSMSDWLEHYLASSKAKDNLAALLNGSEPFMQSELLEGDSELSAMLLLPLTTGKHSFGMLGILAESLVLFDEQEMALLSEMAGDVAYGINALRTAEAHQHGMERIQKTMLQTIEAVSITLEKRDPYTAGHQQRVVELAVAIAQKMGVDAGRIEGIRLGALVHDIGKIYVPAEILNRPGRLSESEFGIIKSHPDVGYDILKGIEFDWPIADMVLQHHERLDGSGYPHGLKGEAIVLEARILAVADVVEAITSHRPYRAGLGLDVALDEISKGRGTLYDEQVADTCLKLFREEGFSWSEGSDPLRG